MRPHTITPLHWRERGIQFPQHKHKHTSQARGDEARKAQGGGERNLHLVFRGRWTIARGPSHTPFGGVRSLASTYRRCVGPTGPHQTAYTPTASAADQVAERMGGQLSSAIPICVAPVNVIVR
eukprot:scaffold5173_cov125-Isochrysis_galbana.AAC.14